MFKRNFLIICLIVAFILSSCTPVVKKEGKTSSYGRIKNKNSKTTERPDYSKLKKGLKEDDVVLDLDRDEKVTGEFDELIEKYWGIPYRYGGNGKSGFDCSGFVMKLVEEAWSIKLPRSSSEQYTRGRYVSKNNLRYGDLVFFNTSGDGVSHVGIYLGNSKFAHASEIKGVTISNMDNDYYKKRYIGARRLYK